MVINNTNPHNTEVSNGNGTEPISEVSLQPLHGWMYIGRVSQTKGCPVYSSPSLPHPFASPFTNFWSFSWQPTGQKIQKAELFPANPTFLPPPYTSTKVITSALFSILIVISFDRTCSLSLNTQITNAILFSSSSSLVTNSISCTRVSSSLKTSRANLCSCIVQGVISRLQEG